MISDVTKNVRLRKRIVGRISKCAGSLEQIKDYAIFTMDVDCKATSWNKGVKQVLGFDEMSLLAMTS